MKTIPLTQGKVALVDDRDYGFLSQWKWHAMHSAPTWPWYAARGRLLSDGVGAANILMHRVILNPDKELQVDHINGDGLDNRRSNLRPSTELLNHRNGHRRNPTRLGLPLGVRSQNEGRFQARIGGDQPIVVGVFDTAEKAHIAYLSARAQRIKEAELLLALTPLLNAIRLVESGGRANPPDGDWSKKHRKFLAIGPCQIHESFHKDSGVKGDWQDCRDAEYAQRVIVAYWTKFCPQALARRDWRTLANTFHLGRTAARRGEVDEKYLAKVRAAGGGA